MRKALKTQAYRLSPPSSEMIVGPAVDTMVTSMKARRSPASRPARIRVTVLRECDISAAARPRSGIGPDGSIRFLPSTSIIDVSTSSFSLRQPLGLAHGNQMTRSDVTHERLPQGRALLTRVEGVATHNENSDRLLVREPCHPSHRSVRG